MLFTIGLVLMAMPIADYLLGDRAATGQSARLARRAHRSPRRRDRRLSPVHHRRLRRHRRDPADFLVKTRFGAQLRAAVDDARVAQGLGINVDRIFAIAFAVGSGLAGLGGALAADVVGGIDPSFPVKFLVTFLIVVTVGGSNGILGRPVRRALLGVLDVAGKYYVPSIGAFIIYGVMVVTLIVRPQGLFARGDGR